MGASQAREFSLSPAVTASQAMEFSLFPLLEALQAAEFQIARQRRLDSPPNPVFFECVSMFLQWFPSKHGTLHFCRHKTGRKHHVRQCFQFPYLPNRWKYRYLQCFLQFFHVPPVANSNIYIYIRAGHGNWDLTHLESGPCFLGAPALFSVAGSAPVCAHGTCLHQAGASMSWLLFEENVTC